MVPAPAAVLAAFAPLPELPLLIVLGAPNDAEGRLLPVAAGRAATAAREYLGDPRYRVVLTGGFGAHFNQTARPHFEYVAEALAAAGVPPTALLGCVASATTIEDARLCAELLAPREQPLHLKIVTSDFHTTRARLLFERAFAARGAAHRARIDLVAAPVAVPAEELVRALRHEADAIARLAAAPV
jgi:uncharacterized SAM-binding protein YcdF (DUF218 family)